MAEVTRGATSGRATLRDVAERAGVSPQTVSNYLNGRHVTRPATRERVDRAIRELGYRPNAAARALRSQRARAIAFVFEDPNDLGLHDPLHMEFLHGVAAAAHELDYHLTISRTAPGETVPAALRLVREGRADGLILSLGGLDANRDPIRGAHGRARAGGAAAAVGQRPRRLHGLGPGGDRRRAGRGAPRRSSATASWRGSAASPSGRARAIAATASCARRGRRARGCASGRARRTRSRARASSWRRSWPRTTARPACWRRTT